MTSHSQPSDNHPGQSSADDPSDWQTCPRGTVQRVLHDLQTRRIRRRIGQAAAVAVGVILLSAVAIWAWPGGSGTGGALDNSQIDWKSIRNISCRQVIKHLDQYLAGKVDLELELRIDKHMMRCSRCRNKLPHDHVKQGLIGDAGQHDWILALAAADGVILP